MTARSRLGPSTCLPAAMMCPALGVSRPARMLRMVDLPHPEWPITQANSPSATVNHRSSKTVSSPLPEGSGKRLASPSTLMKDRLIDILGGADPAPTSPPPLWGRDREGGMAEHRRE